MSQELATRQALVPIVQRLQECRRVALARERFFEQLNVSRWGAAEGGRKTIGTGSGRGLSDKDGLAVR